MKRDFEQAMVKSAFLVALFPVILVALAIVTIVLAACWETVSIYRRYAPGNPQVARWLWGSLALLLFSLTVPVLLTMQSFDNMWLALLVAAWEFFVFVVVVETVALKESQREQARLQGDDLDNYLGNFAA